MKISDIVTNAFLDDLGTDWVAIDSLGRPVGRATTEAAVRRAVPDAVMYLTGSDMDAEEAPVLDLPPVDVEAMQVVEAHAAAGRVWIDDPAPKVDGGAFDHDGDGRPGGSLPKTRKRGRKA